MKIRFELVNSPGPQFAAGQRRSYKRAMKEAMKIRLSLLFVSLLPALVLADDDAVAQDQPAKFNITTRRKDDAVEVQADKGKTIFNVKSPFGISQAVIERDGKKWPDAVMLRLHLKGLSSF